MVNIYEEFKQSKLRFLGMVCYRKKW